MSGRVVCRRLGIAATTLLVSMLSISPTCSAQSGVLFPPPTQSSWPGIYGFGLEENVGLSAATLNNNYVVWFRGDRTDGFDITYLCGVENLNVMNCPQDSIPNSSAPGQITVWKNQYWMAYAQAGTANLVLCSSSDGLSFNNSNCAVHSEIQVADSPAISPTADGTELDIAYQEHASAHRLGIGYSTDGVHFTWGFPNNGYQIGHTPAMIAFNGKIVIAAMCQCGSSGTHYLDVYTSTGHGQLSFLTEDQSQTLANASPPSLAVAKNVLVLGYMQNGYRYFQISTSYDAQHWTPKVQQINIYNVAGAWGGPALVVVGNQLWLFFNPQGSRLGARQLSWSATSLPQ